jgi:hypothetical protein
MNWRAMCFEITSFVAGTEAITLHRGVNACVPCVSDIESKQENAIGDYTPFV